MSAVAEAASLLRQVAEPRPVGDTVKAAINRASRRVSRFMRSPMKPSRVEDIWREEAKAIRAEEMDAIRRAAKDKQALGEARNEMAALEARLARIEALLVQDADYYGPHVDALREAMGRPNSPLDRGE